MNASIQNNHWWYLGFGLFFSLTATLILYKTYDANMFLQKENIEKVNAWLHKANEYYANKDYGNAIELYKNILALKPRNTSLLTRTSLSYARLAKFDDAIFYAQQVADLEKQNASAQLMLGYFHEKKELFMPAMKFYKAAIQINPEMFEGHLFLAKLLLKIQFDDIDTIIDHAEKAIALNPKHEDALLSLSLAYFHVGDKNKAIANCQKALSLFPGSEQGHKLLTYIEG